MYDGDFEGYHYSVDNSKDHDDGDTEGDCDQDGNDYLPVDGDHGSLMVLNADEDDDDNLDAGDANEDQPGIRSLIRVRYE